MQYYGVVAVVRTGGDMAIEIERKFLVVSEEWQQRMITSKRLVQAYLSRGPGTSVRIRIEDDTSSTLTIKSEGAHRSRFEFEYPIPLSDAQTLLELRIGSVVSKRRHLVPHNGIVWEVDVFSADNAGLVIAEIELEHENQKLTLPSWVGAEITHDDRYSNSRLAQRPYRSFVPAEEPAIVAAR
jgi:adenylate cyclase